MSTYKDQECQFEEMEEEEEDLIENNYSMPPLVQHAEISTQTVLPTAKYQYLKTHDWENSLIFKYMQSRVINTSLIIVDQETQNRLLMQADLENEDEDYYLVDGQDSTLYTQLLSQSMFYHYKKSRRLLSQLECEYHANILKRKLHMRDRIDEEHLVDIFYVALKTLGALMTLLMLKPQWRRIEEKFAVMEDSSEVNPVTCIKILTRAKKMYDAYAFVIKILKLIAQRELLLKTKTLLPQTQATRDEGYDNTAVGNEESKNLTRLCSKITSEITFLQEEHRIFKRPFILQGIDYLEILSRQGYTQGDDLSLYANHSSGGGNS